LSTGGNKILLAAGSSIAPYWGMYAVHKTAETRELLEEYRIGNLPEDEVNMCDLTVAAYEYIQRISFMPEVLIYRCICMYLCNGLLNASREFVMMLRPVVEVDYHRVRFVPLALYDQVEETGTTDVYANEPERDPSLIIRTETPFNAETPVAVLQEYDVTPTHLHFKRHHLPVPAIQVGFSSLVVSSRQYPVFFISLSRYLYWISENNRSVRVVISY
jgi:hypothetical protein